MSVILETSLGDVTVDLLSEFAPKCCENFLKLCKVKYYNYAPVFGVQKGFSFQSGDPVGPGAPGSDGGSSIWGLLGRTPEERAARKTFQPEFHPKLKHAERGTLSMATAASSSSSNGGGGDDAEDRLAGSQFIVTLGDNLDYLDGKAAIFGKVVEGFDTLEKINHAFVDETGRPLKDIRIRHTIVLDDPYDDPPGLVEPPESPVPSPAQLATVRIADDEDIAEDTDQEALEKLRREREARAQALTLEMMGDLPFAEVKPPENVLFVCKLNPVTLDKDLEMLFGRFGKILSCEVIRDKRTGDSLQYAFIEFENREDCERAYMKMENVLIDDRRIHVDFSQSVSRLSDAWRTSTNSKRRRQAGGFGGIAGLEKKRQYRAEGKERDDGGYGMVFNEDGEPREAPSRLPVSSDRPRYRSRSRSPRRDRRDKDYGYERRRADRDRDRDGRRGGHDDYNWSRKSDHYGRRDRRDSREERYKDSDRLKGSDRDHDKRRR
ncbi:cyclophilin-like domain-containing protein [Lineolata rhizophorae]|uniref:Peptidyl-prolyl cis-trans isomerase n=1 Tax=Lineolata rhizophorae TaxID=578093 RepID=A0A6A6NPT4_9PEZI|nr:cyclophilin-like domain-containing protein [Lineolata rhizophorae]